jgi:hypothetical protein
MADIASDAYAAPVNHNYLARFEEDTLRPRPSLRH